MSVRQNKHSARKYYNSHKLLIEPEKQEAQIFVDWRLMQGYE